MPRVATADEGRDAEIADEEDRGCIAAARGWPFRPGSISLSDRRRRRRPSSEYLRRAESGGPVLAAARGAGRGGAGAAALSSAAAVEGAPVRRAGLGGGPPRTEAAGRHPRAALGRVSRPAPGRLRLFRLLRALPPLGGAALAGHAPAPCRGRADVRRLFRHEDGGHRPGHRRGASGGDLHRRDGRLEHDLCRGELEPGAARLDRRPHPRLRLLRRGAGAGRVRQPEVRGDPRLLLRAGGQPQLCRDGGALRHGHPARAPLQAPRQGQGRGRRPARAALDRRPAAQPAVLQPRGTERRHRARRSPA